LAQEHLSVSVSATDAQLELLRHAASALGVATLNDLADYYRMPAKEAAPLINNLVEDEALSTVVVEGWGATAYLASTARLPRTIKGASLLSPFDPVVWFRPRAERLFGFHYRIEIYVPAAERKWGYYVLPFRVADEIVARVDIKADRQAQKLLVLATHDEKRIDRSTCVDRLARELQVLADWLGLDEVRVTRHNDISRKLAATV
jgi:uncharacterized protein YcaQ